MAGLKALTNVKTPPSRHSRFAIIVGAALLAAVIHLLTGGRWTPLLVVFVAIASLLAVLPRLAWLVKPIGTYIGMWLVFNLLRAGADDTEWADRVLDLVPRLEAFLAGGNLPSAVLQDWFHQPGNPGWHDYGLTTVYMSFFVVPHLVAALLLWKNVRLFWRYTLATGVLFILATISFYVIPTSPPWLAPQLVPDAGFASIQRITQQVLAGLDLPIQLFNESTRGGVRTSEVRMEPNPIAAMPSIHFAATMMIMFPARRARSPLFAVTTVYTLLMGIALVYLGEHFVLDLVAGGAMATIGWVVASQALGLMRARNVIEPHHGVATS